MIRFGKDGKILNIKFKKENPSSSEQVEYTDFIFKNEQVLFLLNENRFELVYGFTLRDLFKIIDVYPNLQLINPFLPYYIRKFKELPQIGCVNETVSSIHIKPMIHYKHKLNEYDFEFNFEKIPETEFSTMKTKKTLTGKNEQHIYSISFDVYGKSKNDDEEFAIEFTPLNEILDLPIFIEKNGSLNIAEEIDDNSLNFTHKKQIICYESFSIYDFISNIIGEITFFGDEEQKESEINKIKSQIQDIENNEKRD